MFDTTMFFKESIDLREHPLKNSKEKIKTEYFTALSFLLNEVMERSFGANNSSNVGVFGEVIHASIVKQYFQGRLEQYKSILDIQAEIITSYDDLRKKESLRSLFACIRRPWRNKYRHWLICDMALITLDPALVKQANEIMKSFLSKKKAVETDTLCSQILDKKLKNEKFVKADSLIKQYHQNTDFVSKFEKRIIVTANMSAGKSTLINALIGKPIARTSQEACTGNVCYMYNKPFEDGAIHLISPKLNLDATVNELRNYEWNGEISIASYFKTIECEVDRLCIIDTPGVNAEALYKSHSKISRDALLNLSYDKIIYIVSPTNLGTDAEIKHLKWTSENLDKNKIVFVLNKLDDYRSSTDSVEESVDGLRTDLEKLGFENPIICPISAYFGLLLKMKITGQGLTEDELDEYTLLAKKFNKASYDLSDYYKNCECLETDSDEIKLSKKSGLYGLENILYGGFYEKNIH